MRIGLNLLYLIPDVVGGTETYARGLLQGLKQLETDYEFLLFVNKESAKICLDDPPKIRSVVCPVSAVNRRSRYFFEQVKLRRYIGKYGIHLLHSLGYISPLFLPCPTVVTVHDLNMKAFGNQMQFTRRLMLNLFVQQSIIRSDKIITVSEFSRDEILNEYHIPSNKIVVTHEAVDLYSLEKNLGNEIDNPLEQLGPRQPYIVAFSSSYPNKNISRLLEAFLELKTKKRLEQKLVLIGHKYLTERGKSSSDLLEENEDILWTGYVDRSQVFKILKKADLLVFPSFYEGFGLPILEAMAAGVPVVCSKAASLPEVAGDAAVFFDPFSVKDIADNIVSVATNPDLRANLRQKGFKNLERFSWKLTAAKTVAVYDDLLAHNKVIENSR
jgi:glycosyltransferase involved in cell wall biosynthesis